MSIQVVDNDSLPSTSPTSSGEKEATPSPGNASEQIYSSWVHGFAVALTASVFPLIWVGGLVTTYDAGMAVPDWPGTYGWNLFAYPASTWLFGSFDLMVEHGHRLLGAVAGFLSIFLVIAAWKFEQRLWFKLWTVGILVAVIAQGTLGGYRVLLDQRTFAMIHGCTASLFFALATATAVMSSRWWLGLTKDWQADLKEWKVGFPLACTATLMLFVSYGQLIMGAQVRHITGSTSPKIFTAFVHSHLALAVLVLLIALALAARTAFARRIPARVKRPTLALLILVGIQIALGVGTWIVNYAVPWESGSGSLANYTIEAKGYWESMIVTGHVATGALIISVSTVAMLRSWRTRRLIVNSATG